MRCCVPFCKNVLTSERIGELTFHGLPSEQNLRAAWLKALSTQELQLPEPAMVCSQHFLDDDFYKTKGCGRQIHSDAIPSTLQVCMICLDTDSKQVLMSKHKLEEAYQQLTGLSLHRRGNLKQTLCVLCAQRLVNFSRFRDLCLSANSLMTQLLEQHEFITLLHKELLNCSTKHLRCNLTLTTLGSDHCDLYIDHSDEDSRQQTAAEESVGDLKTVVVKNEHSSDLNADYMELAKEDENDIESYNHDRVPDKYCNINIKLEFNPVDEDINESKAAAEESVVDIATVVVKNEHSSDFMSNADSLTFVREDDCDMSIKLESAVVDEVAEIENDHMSMHLQVRPFCTFRRSSSRDSLDLDDKTESQGLNDDPPPAADCAPALVARLAANNANKVQATGEAGAIQKCEQILETNISEMGQIGHSSQSSFKSYTDINKFTNCVVELNDISKKPKKAVLDQNRRVRSHTGAKPYSCDICNYKSTRKSHLLIHIRTHTGEKPYSCEICNYKCSQKCRLVEHKKIHTGEKPHSCDTCNYKCLRKGDLLIHKRTHTGERPYSCEICNYKCSTKCHLLEHKRTHTGYKPYSCDTCNFKCIQKTDLSRHIKAHTGERPYSCEICDYKGKRKSHLVQHMRIHTKAC